MINLLSPQTRSARRTEALLRRVMFMAEIVFSLMVILGGLMLAEVMYSDDKLALQEDRLATLTASDGVRRIAEIDQSLRTLKTDVDRLSRIQDQHTEIFLLIWDLLHTVDPATTLNELTVDTTRKAVTFSGVSPTRASLITLKERLQASPSYTDVVLPLQSLLKERDIPFTFTFALKP